MGLVPNSSGTQINLQPKEMEMRRLSAKQKKYLSKTGAFHVDDLSAEVYTLVESFNSYETFHQDAERFLSDEYFKNQTKGN